MKNQQCNCIVTAEGGTPNGPQLARTAAVSSRSASDRKRLLNFPNATLLWWVLRLGTAAVRSGSSVKTKGELFPAPLVKVISGPALAGPG